MVWREQDIQNCSTFPKLNEIDLEDFYTKWLLWDQIEYDFKAIKLLEWNRFLILEKIHWSYLPSTNIKRQNQKNETNNSKHALVADYFDVNRNERLIFLVYTSNYGGNGGNHLINETTFGYIHTSSIKLELLMLSTISLLFSCISTDLLLISCSY